MSRPLISRLRRRRRKRYELTSRCRLLALAALNLIACEIRRRSERHFARHPLNLEEMPQDEFRFFFRIESYDDFLTLLRSLELDPEIRCHNGTCVTSEHALAVVLRRLAYPNRWGDVMGLLGREKTQLSRIFNATVNKIYEKKGYLLETLDWISAAQAAKYARAIHLACGYYGRKLTPLFGMCRLGDNRYKLVQFVHGVPIADNCIGFLDGTARIICKPGSRQQDFYSGHNGKHAFKLQLYLGPDGLMLNFYGPVEGRRHDSYMLYESQLVNRLRRKNVHWGRNYCLYADKGYSVSEEIQTPFQWEYMPEHQVAFNKTMSVCRTSVEYGFLKITQYFAFGNYWQNQKIFLQQVCKTYIVSALFANCHTCLYGYDLVISRFNVNPPSLETYLGSKPQDFN